MDCMSSKLIDITLSYETIMAVAKPLRLYYNLFSEITDDEKAKKSLWNLVDEIEEAESFIFYETGGKYE